MGNYKVRIIDIAEAAKVSRGTVDRVIHNRGNVSAEIKNRILKVIEELKYEKNILASTLAYNRAFVIGVLLPDPSKDPYWTQPYDGIEEALKSVEHYGVKLQYYYFNEDDTSSFDLQSEKILKERIDGLIITPTLFLESKELLRTLEEKSIPYVQINTNLNRENQSNLGFIGQNSYQSGFLAGKLLSYNLRDDQSVAIVHLEKNLANAHHLLEKETGFKDFFAQFADGKHEIHQITCSPFGLEFNKLHDLLDKNLASIPDLGGIFVSTSRVYLIAQYLQTSNIVDKQLVGFDLIDKNIQFLESGHIQFLINQNPFQQGYYALMRIVEFLLKGLPFAKVQNLPLDIVLKENYHYYLQVSKFLKILA